MRSFGLGVSPHAAAYPMGDGDSKSNCVRYFALCQWRFVDRFGNVDGGIVVVWQKSMAERDFWGGNVVDDHSGNRVCRIQRMVEYRDP